MIGTRLDDLLKLPGRGRKDMVEDSTLEGQDEQGFIVAMHYEKDDVILHHRKGCYRVRETRDKD